MNRFRELPLRPLIVAGALGLLFIAFGVAKRLHGQDGQRDAEAMKCSRQLRYATDLVGLHGNMHERGLGGPRLKMSDLAEFQEERRLARDLVEPESDENTAKEEWKSWLKCPSTGEDYVIGADGYQVSCPSGLFGHAPPRDPAMHGGFGREHGQDDRF